MSNAANAGVIGVAGWQSSLLDTFLTSEGHTVVDFGWSPPLDDASYAGLDGLVLSRLYGNDAIEDWVRGGGTLVTEYNSGIWAMNTTHLIGGSIVIGGEVGLGTPVTFTAAGLAAGMGTGVPTTYSDGGSTEFFMTFTSFDPAKVLATRPINTPVMIGDAADAGHVVVIGYDLLDQFGVHSQQVLLNALNFGAGSGAGQGPSSVPAPSTMVMLLLGLASLTRIRRRVAV